MMTKLQPAAAAASTTDLSGLPVTPATSSADSSADSGAPSLPVDNSAAALVSFLDQLLQAQPVAVPALPADAAPAQAEPAVGPQGAKPAKPEVTEPLPDLPAALTAPNALPQALVMALQQMQQQQQQARPAPTQAASQPVAAPAPKPLPMAAAPAAPQQQDLTPALTAVVAKPAVAGKDDGTPETGLVEPAVPFAAQLAAAPVDGKTAAPAPAPAVLHLPTTQSPQQWQSPLLQALGDRIQLQIAARSEQATIRLEPPQLGRVDIEIRQAIGGAGPLQVRLEATHVEVVQQLQQISDGLRWNLSQQRQGGEVVVQVGSSASANANAQTNADARHGQGRQDDQQQPRRPGRALDEGADTAAAFALN